MKRLFYPLTLSLILIAASCTKADSANEIKQEITKEVKAEIIDGETTVTITTTEGGKTETKVLTGQDAENYMKEDHLKGMDHNNGSEVIIKKLDHNMEIDLDTEDIMADPSLQALDEATKEKVKAALDNALKDLEIEMDLEESDFSETKMKTKVIVVNEH